MQTLVCIFYGQSEKFIKVGGCLSN